jgi:hypothetical protein
MGLGSSVGSSSGARKPPKVQSLHLLQTTICEEKRWPSSFARLLTRGPLNPGRHIYGHRRLKRDKARHRCRRVQGPITARLAQDAICYRSRRGGRDKGTVWDIPKAQKMDGGHPTQKPVECMKRPIENNSSPGQAVYDPFVGSGTTIIAAEMTGRCCHASQ